MLGQGLWPRSHFVEVVNFAFLTKPSFVIWYVVLFVNMAPFGYRQVFFWFKGSSEKKLSINFGCVVSKKHIWFTISKFWVLFFNFEWTLWYYVDFFFLDFVILFCTESWRQITPWETEADVITWNIQVFQLVLIFILFCSSRRRDFPVKWCFWQFKRQITG